MVQDNTLSVGFIIDGEDGIPQADQQRLVPYCLPTTDCANDGFQFHMSKLDVSSTKSGRLSNPYNYNMDNHYALDGAGDIRLYHINILRRTQKTFDVKVYERNGKDELILKAQKTASPDFGTWWRVDNAFPQQYLAIKSNEAPGTVLEFHIAGPNRLEFRKGDLDFNSDDKGIAGPYCEVGGVNYVGQSDQWINCDVPVLA